MGIWSHHFSFVQNKNHLDRALHVYSHSSQSQYHIASPGFFSLLVLSFLLFFRFFLSLFYLIPVWFLLRSHFSLFSHTVILHKATNYFYTQPDVMTEYRRFVFCVSLASLLFCWDRANDPLCLYSLFDGTWNCKITKVNKFRCGKM